MKKFGCPYLKAKVEMTDERERHIAEHHPDLLPKHLDKLRKTLARPDQVRRSVRFGRARLFSKWYDDLKEGKHVVVVVVSEAEPRARHWIITAYVTAKLTKGEVEWQRN